MIATALLSGSLHGATEPAPLRVLTFNLRYINSGDTGNRTWTARRDQVGAVVAKDQSDIIGIQEGFRSMLDDLQARVPGYVEIGGGREDGLAKGEYSALLVKADRFTIQESGTFWLSDTPEVVGSRTWGNQVVRICTWAKLYDRASKRSIHVFNTHLDHQTPLARQKGVELILERMKATGSQGPFILTGDLNAKPDESLHAAIKGDPHQLSDVWATLHPNAPLEESGTCHPFNGQCNGARIDYIYASKSFGCADSQILRDNLDGVYPSDHFPVRATLTFAPEQPVATP